MVDWRSAWATGVESKASGSCCAGMMASSYGDTTSNSGDTVAELPGLSSPCTMKYGESVLTAFSVGCTPPIQRKTGTDLLARPHPIDTLLHLAIAPIAPLHRMRGGGQQLSVETRAGLVQRGGKELLQCLPHLWAPLEPTPQFGPCVQSGLGPPASIA